MFQRYKTFCFDALKLQTWSVQSRYKSVLSKAEAKERRNLLFEDEKKKQRDAVGRIEKIEVKCRTAVDEITLIMNKRISTPADCAKHVSEGVVKVSALALVDDTLWDMHKPLTSNCTVKFLNLQNPENIAVNTAFWRTCSFLLGSVMDSAFKSNVTIHLHSFPMPNIRSGSFVHDIYLNLPDWKPSNIEMRALSAQYIKLCNQELPIERIETTEDVALNMFQDNPFKSHQIPDIAKANNNRIILYRVGNHVDISKGPMIGNTSLVGRCTVTAIHKLSESESENLYRVQGVALPKGVLLNHFAYSILEKRAAKFNDSAWMPQSMLDNMVAPTKMSATS